MQINPQDIASRDMYKLLIGSVQPRPIAWVSSVDANGVPNLAPYSFFTAVCSDPPTIIFCPGVRRQTGLPKDSLLNVRETGEFVVNIVTESLAEKMNITSTELDHDVNEFEYAGVQPAESVMVNVPRVAESPIAIECKLDQIVTISDQPGGGFIVVGRVVYMHINDDVYIPDFKIDTLKVQPVGRLAGPGYTKVNDLFEMPRPKPQLSER